LALSASWRHHEVPQFSGWDLSRQEQQGSMQQYMPLADASCPASVVLAVRMSSNPVLHGNPI
jgi:hypothetical protein